ncbi:hypothetical protein INR49_031254 [Caranx melampygus]|nr:hypothetical protein INR49_031254 [Caranx melampygus]
MLITMLTAMYMMVRVVESIGVRFARQQEPIPYMVSQPLPWQVHSVSHSRRTSKAEETPAMERALLLFLRSALLKLRRPLLPSRPISGSSNRRNTRTANRWIKKGGGGGTGAASLRDNRKQGRMFTKRGMNFVMTCTNAYVHTCKCTYIQTV